MFEPERFTDLQGMVATKYWRGGGGGFLKIVLLSIFFCSLYCIVTLPVLKKFVLYFCRTKVPLLEFVELDSHIILDLPIGKK